MSLLEFIANIRHNRRLYETGLAKRNELRHTTIGWRRDPFCENDGFVEDCGRTPSGNVEYSAADGVSTVRKA